MLSRRTRSNKVFSPWDVLYVESSNPDFDLDDLLLARIQEESESPSDLSEDDEDRPSLPTGFFSHPVPPLVSTLPTFPIIDPSPLNNNIQKGETLQLPRKENPSPPTENPGKRKRNDASHARRAKRRANPEFGSTKPRKSIHERYEDAGTTVDCAVDIQEGPVTSTGYDALRDVGGPEVAYPLSYFVGKKSELNFTRQRWDGRKPTALIDRKGRLIGVLAGHPDAPDWPSVCKEAAQALENAQLRCNRPATDAGHRGGFSSLRCGVSHGGGQKEPGNLHNTVGTQKIIDELNDLECFQRISNFSTSVMATRTPKLHQHYAEKMGKLYRRDKRLKRPFPGSIQSSTTYNLGPQTVCYPHRDKGNLAYGMCSITPTGDFDHTKGGHLVLWECRLVVEFPPGSTILIPSAIITHSNTAIGPNESRYSFTQYTAGALFRWVDNNFQKAMVYRDLLTCEERKKRAAADAARWKFGLSLLPIIEKKQ